MLSFISLFFLDYTLIIDKKILIMQASGITTREAARLRRLRVEGVRKYNTCYIAESKRALYHGKDLEGLSSNFCPVVKQRYVANKDLLVEQIIDNSKLIIAKLTGDYEKTECNPIELSTNPSVGLEQLPVISKMIGANITGEDSVEASPWVKDFWGAGSIYEAPLVFEKKQASCDEYKEFTRKLAYHFPLQNNIDLLFGNGPDPTQVGEFHSRWEKFMLKTKSTIRSCVKYAMFVFENMGELIQEGDELDRFYWIFEEIIQKFGDHKKFWKDNMEERMLKKKQYYLNTLFSSASPPTLKELKVMKLDAFDVAAFEGFWGEGKTETMCIPTAAPVHIKCCEPDMIYRSMLKTTNEPVVNNQNLIVAMVIFSKVVELLRCIQNPCIYNIGNINREMFETTRNDILVTDRFYLSHEYFRTQAQEKYPNTIFTPIPLKAWSGLYGLHSLNLMRIPMYLNVHIYLKTDPTFIPWPIRDYRTMEQVLYPSEDYLRKKYKEWLNFVENHINDITPSNQTFEFIKDEENTKVAKRNPSVRAHPYVRPPKDISRDVSPQSSA